MTSKKIKIPGIGNTDVPVPAEPTATSSNSKSWFESVKGQRGNTGQEQQKQAPLAGSNVECVA